MVTGSGPAGRIGLVVGTEVPPVLASGADSGARVGGGVGERLGGVIAVLSGEFDPEGDSGRGRVIEGRVRLIGIAVLHKKSSQIELG